MMLLWQLARQAGMPHYFSLGEKIINKVGDKHIGRLLLNAETDLNTVKTILMALMKANKFNACCMLI